MEGKREHQKLWISDYRDKILRPQWRSELEGPALIEYLKSPDILRVKFVRNPFIRLVSAFVHCFRFELRPERRHENPVRNDWPTPLGNEMLNISFREFVAFLYQKGVQPGKCDPHYSQQKMLFEDNILTYKLILPVEQLHHSFSLLRQYDPEMPKLDDGFDKKEKSYHKTKLYSLKAECVADIPFSGLVKLNGYKEHFPHYRYFFDNQLRKVTSHLYREDFKAYGYSSTRIPVN